MGLAAAITNGHLAWRVSIGLSSSVRLYGLVDLSLAEAIELFARREDAERMLAELLNDEPGWEPLFRIEEIVLEDPCLN